LNNQLLIQANRVSTRIPQNQLIEVAGENGKISLELAEL